MDDEEVNRRLEMVYGRKKERSPLPQTFNPPSEPQPKVEFEWILMVVVEDQLKVGERR